MDHMARNQMLTHSNERGLVKFHDHKYRAEPSLNIRLLMKLNIRWIKDLLWMPSLIVSGVAVTRSDAISSPRGRVDDGVLSKK
jgi:hypothetical protein